MALTIKLNTSVTVKGQDVKEITLDFDSIRGRDLADAERTARSDGEMNPMINFSMKYQAAIAAKLIGIKYDDVLDMPAGDFNKITLAVNNFLMSSN